MHRFPSVIIVFVSIVAMCTGTEGESKAALTRDYGVKLCGREFIRAVIFTCGGSRWKRSGQVESLQNSNKNPFLLSPNSDLSESRDSLSWMQSALAALEQPQKLSTSLADLLKELGDQSDYESEAEPDQDKKPQWESRWKQGLVMTLGSGPKIPWPRPNRQKRNFSLGLAGMCCNQGCTKNDIGRLC
ncbi:prorelaxin H1 [Anguilla anguilla]|uniref:Insulin-like domain-containing protein n=2 Tax=Anguilla TaxID=7935 RepID=A0A9D3LP64_ANGAN|nr:prorelaxin H1 [Anguilla anguilla]ABW93756.1 relaxin 3c precursor [Anguilla japonica]KAG5834572.1 hypothetical protein ANANG_G00262900 [Anguilla anguilla]BAJ22076.1 relaxin 2 precursor [Anguilla japonica]